MTQHRSDDPAPFLDRAMRDWMHDEAPPSAPDGLLESIVGRAAAAPQGRRPRTAVAVAGMLAVAAAVLAVGVLLGLPELLGRRVGTLPSPTPAAEPSAQATPAASSTAVAPTRLPSPSTAPATADASTMPGVGEPVLVVRTVCDVAPPVIAPQISVVADGRVVWQRGDESPQPGYAVRRLTPEGLMELRDLVERTGLFEATAAYELEPLPGAEPPGMGACLHDFDYTDTDGVRISVTATGWLGDEIESEYFVPSPERRRLDELARNLRAVETMLSEAAWEGGAEPYVPHRYLVAAAVSVPQLAERGTPDVAELSWPVGEPPDAFGAEVDTGTGTYRCALVGARSVEPLLDQLVEFGLDQFERPFVGASVGLPWDERAAALQLVIWTVLPPNEPNCDWLQ